MSAARSLALLPRMVLRPRPNISALTKDTRAFIIRDRGCLAPRLALLCMTDTVGLFQRSVKSSTFPRGGIGAEIINPYDIGRMAATAVLHPLHHYLFLVPCCYSSPDAKGERAAS